MDSFVDGEGNGCKVTRIRIAASWESVRREEFWRTAKPDRIQSRRRETEFSVRYPTSAVTSVIEGCDEERRPSVIIDNESLNGTHSSCPICTVMELHVGYFAFGPQIWSRAVSRRWIADRSKSQSRRRRQRTTPRTNSFQNISVSINRQSRPKVAHFLPEEVEESCIVNTQLLSIHQVWRVSPCETIQDDSIMKHRLTTASKRRQPSTLNRRFFRVRVETRGATRLLR